MLRLITGNVLLLVQLLILAGLLVGAVEVLLRRPAVTAGLILATTVVMTALVEYKPALSVSGFRLNVADAIFSLVLGTGILRRLRVRRFNAAQRMLVLLCLLALFALLRGVSTFGPEASVAQFRVYLYLLAAALYFSTVTPSEALLERVGRLWLWAAAAQVGVVVLRWANNFAGTPIGVLAEQYGTPIRAVSGPETFFLAHAFLVFLPTWWSRRLGTTAQRRLSIALLVLVVLLNRRTSWLALAAGLLLVTVRNRALGRKVAALVVSAAVAGGLLALNLAGVSEGQDDDEPVAFSATDTSTLAWRLEGWDDLFSEGFHGPEQWLAGQPFGAGFEREVYENTKETNPHSFYVQTLLQLGVLGLIGLLTLYAWSIWALTRPSPGENGPAREVLLVMLVAQAVWLLAWIPGLEQGIVTGLGAAAACQRTRRRGHSPPPMPQSREARAGAGPALLAGRALGGQP